MAAKDDMRETEIRMGLEVLIMGAKCGSAHISSSISMLEIVACLLGFKDEHVGTHIVLSKGHAAAAWYAGLVEFGKLIPCPYFPVTYVGVPVTVVGFKPII